MCLAMSALSWMLILYTSFILVRSGESCCCSNWIDTAHCGCNIFGCNCNWNGDGMCWYRFFLDVEFKCRRSSEICANAPNSSIPKVTVTFEYQSYLILVSINTS